MAAWHENSQKKKEEREILMGSDVEQINESGARGWIASVRPTPGWFIALVVGFHFAIIAVLNLCQTTMAAQASGFLFVGVLCWCLGWRHDARSNGGSQRFPTLWLVLLAAWATVVTISPQTIQLVMGSQLFGGLVPYVPWFLTMGLLWTAVGLLRCYDLGLIARKLLPALYWVVATWVVSQLVLVAVHSGDLSLAGKWRDDPMQPIGYLLAQLLGNAMFEELLYRAFLIAQLTLLFRRWKPWSPRTALTYAIVVATITFAIYHVIPDWSHGESPGDIAISQIPRLIMGFVFAGIFLLSNNLFLAVGIHAIANLQMRHASPFYAGDSTWVTAVILLLPLAALAVMVVRRRRMAAPTLPSG